ncbi:hypothetical protein [Paracoccus yeei]|uniref:hypothetical protein n=1 Tax=Paracoccus yeei TaxID=147645 RepID=UPI003BF8DFDD
MTAHQSIPLAGFAEALTPGFTPTPMVQRFAFMQAALALYLDAERDLAHSGAWDPACDHWLRDAEAARTELAAALDAVCATEPARAQDRPLRQLARIARVMLLATDEAEFAQAHGLIAAFGAVLRCPGSGPIDRGVDERAAGFGFADPVAQGRSVEVEPLPVERSGSGDRVVDDQHTC